MLKATENGNYNCLLGCQNGESYAYILKGQEKYG